MNRKSIIVLVLAMLFNLSLVPVFATTIPLPTHKPKTVSPQAFKFVRQQLTTIKQFDLDKLGIPVEKSLRLAGYSGDMTKPDTLTAVSPEDMESMLAWYRMHLHGWKLSDHAMGRTATLISPSEKKGVRVTVTKCLGGSYQLFQCKSFVRFYNYSK
jgi:hypothetical protein